MIAYNQDEAIIDRILMMSSNKSSMLGMKRSKSENGKEEKDDSCIRDIDLGGGEVALEVSDDDSYGI
jgi:hypothetical protein